MVGLEDSSGRGASVEGRSFLFRFLQQINVSAWLLFGFPILAWTWILIWDCVVFWTFSWYCPKAEYHVFLASHGPTLVCAGAFQDCALPWLRSPLRSLSQQTKSVQPMVGARMQADDPLILGWNKTTVCTSVELGSLLSCLQPCGTLHGQCMRCEGEEASCAVLVVTSVGSTGGAVDQFIVLILPCDGAASNHHRWQKKTPQKWRLHRHLGVLSDCRNSWHSWHSIQPVKYQRLQDTKRGMFDGYHDYHGQVDRGHVCGTGFKSQTHTKTICVRLAHCFSIPSSRTCQDTPFHIAGELELGKCICWCCQNLDQMKKHSLQCQDFPKRHLSNLALTSFVKAFWNYWNCSILQVSISSVLSRLRAAGGKDGLHELALIPDVSRRDTVGSWC